MLCGRGQRQEDKVEDSEEVEVEVNEEEEEEREVEGSEDAGDFEAEEVQDQGLLVSLIYFDNSFNGSFYLF